MTRIALALLALGFFTACLPTQASARDYVYHGHHYKHRKMVHGHWHYY